MEQIEIDSHEWEGESQLCNEEFNRLLGLEYITENKIDDPVVEEITEEIIHDHYGEPSSWAIPCGCVLEEGTNRKCSGFEKCKKLQRYEECAESCGPGCMNQPFRNNSFKTKFRLIPHYGRGFGLHIMESVRCNEFIEEYIGEVLLERRNPYNPSMYASGLSLTTGYDTLVIDSTASGNLSRYICHSHVPNCRVFTYFAGGNLHNVIMAIRDISPGTELTWNYGPNFRKIGIKRCVCVASCCPDLDKLVKEFAKTLKSMVITSGNNSPTSPRGSRDSSSPTKRSTRFSNSPYSSPGQIGLLSDRPRTPLRQQQQQLQQQQRPSPPPPDNQRPGHSRNLLPEFYPQREGLAEQFPILHRPPTPQKKASRKTKRGSGDIQKKRSKRLKRQSPALLSTPSSSSSSPSSNDLPSIDDVCIQETRRPQQTTSLLSTPVGQGTMMAPPKTPKKSAPVPRIEVNIQTPRAIVLVERLPSLPPIQPPQNPAATTRAQQIPVQPTRELRSRKGKVLMPCGLEAIAPAPGDDAPVAPRGRGRPRTRPLSPPGPKIPKKRGAPLKDPARLICPHCERAFTKMFNKNRHMEGFHGTARNWHCPGCDLRFKTKGSCYDHSKLHWPDEDLTWYICPTCGKAFLKRIDCERHINRKNSKCERNQDPIVERPTRETWCHPPPEYSSDDEELDLPSSDEN